MKLEKIKLSGFKSFVDQTTIPVDGNLTAIVGPNGCGKSNIIDAIRWVMGESSAKHLRGGSMADVVFNGSATRSPVSTASVELVFDNSEGKVGGEYAKYNKLAIKRQVSREGQSLYLLNGSRCRRKDITDLFLGTGLGARSYAIIEQGTISRMVEAKPEDLRVHIEEAAGISKYKERRQETETRMRHTRENLDRLNDVREEVISQLKHLHKQAQKAEKYTEFKKQQRLYKLEVLAMRWHEHHLLFEELDKKLQAIAGEHNRLFVLHRAHEKNLDNKRNEQKSSQQQLDTTQEHFYQLSAEIARLQQVIEHHEKSQQETSTEIARLQQHFDSASQDYQQELEQLEELKQKFIETEEQLLIAEEAEQQVQQQQYEIQQLQSSWQQQWEHYRSESSKNSQHEQLQQVKINQLHQQNQQLQSRLQKLQQERGELSATQLQLDIAALKESIALIEQQRNDLHQQLTNLQQLSATQKQQLKQTQQNLHDNKAILHSINGKISSLELLQQHALGKDKKKLNLWLEQSGLANKPRLPEFLEVEAGWEHAVEIVLGHCLQALCLEDIDDVLNYLPTLDNESIALFENKSSTFNVSSSNFPALINKVSANFDLSGLLSNIYCVQTLAEARELSKQLTANESVISADGIWLGHNWLKTFARDNSNSGVLQREKQLRSLRQQQQDTQQQIEQQESLLSELEDTLKQFETDMETLRIQEKSLNAEVLAQHAQMSAENAKLEQQQRRLQQINSDIEELEMNLHDNAEQLSEAELLKQEANEMQERLELEKEQLEQQQQQLSQKYEHINHALNQARQQHHALQSQFESLKVAEKAAQKHLESLKQQQNHSGQRLNELQTKRKSELTPLDDEKNALETLLKQQQKQDETLTTQRTQHKTLENEINAISAQLAQTDKAMAEQKEALDKVRFEQQEAQVRQQTFSEQLKEFESDVETVLKNLTEGAELESWKQRLDEVTQKIERLGSINLTAIEEYKGQSERKAFLDEQHNDLTEALNTLTQAIEKIDKETRLRFKETFDRINAGLQAKFPKLFGGGQAYLELTEQNILECGVNIIARPPGKKNSSIHLLSGGEKALTAVALVFSIFELNPAPFCLLDEVDAPLDDANVGRFSKMVEEMSESVQFLFISHNKVTMEIARQLTGVTMKEPGVSRMVAVNIEDAVELAES